MHEQVGHLVFASLALVNQVNPALVVIENVCEYAKTGSAWILRHQFRDMGYVAHEAIISGRDFGCLEPRTRWCMVAASRGIDFSWDDFLPKLAAVRHVEDILDPSIGPDDERWRTFEYLKVKQVRDKAKGNSFAMQTIGPEDTRVPTLRKGYHKGGSTDPLLRHPTNPDLLRKLTGDEIARVKDVPPHILENLSEVVKIELLGQGILYEPFAQGGEHLGRQLITQFADGNADDALDDSHTGESAARKMRVSG